MNDLASYSERLHNVIPGGAHTYSRGDDQFPKNAPPILARGLGAYVYDPNDNEYLDYGMGLRSVTLGYANKQVNQAAIQQINNGVNLSRPSVIELEAANVLIDLIPSADMVKFAKNGSNVTTAAIKIARAATGKKFICVPRQHPFFSFDDWFIGTTPIQRGIPEEKRGLVLLFDYGDINSLKKLFIAYENDIAAVLLEPATTVTPCPSGCVHSQSKCTDCPNKQHNFLSQVQTLCHKEKALFILDEMITGFRWNLHGAQYAFDVTPDLSTFGKGMANGFPLAALVGKREYMELGDILTPNRERLFLLSSTHGSEMTSLGAFVETVKVYNEQNVIDHIWTYGRALFDGVNSISQELGLLDCFSMQGVDPVMNYVTKDSNKEASLAFRTLFNQEMVKQGVLMPWVSVSLSHGESELDRTLAAVRQALLVYQHALTDGVEKYLEGESIKPVFRKFN